MLKRLFKNELVKASIGILFSIILLLIAYLIRSNIVELKKFIVLGDILSLTSILFFFAGGITCIYMLFSIIEHLYEKIKSKK